MKIDHLNSFIPYENKDFKHEDQLTRIFLVLVKSSKIVETVFLDLIRISMLEIGIKELPPNPFDQTAGITTIETQVHSNTKKALENETGRLVSIIITDKRIKIDHLVSKTKRTGIYDAYIKCIPDWVFVIENKPNHKNIWFDQLSSCFNENFEVEKKPVVITWAAIINRLLYAQENGLLYDAAHILVDDFLSYINFYYPELNPYHTFAVCKGNKSLLEKRCRVVMEGTNIGNVKHHRGWHDYIELRDTLDVKCIRMATLYPEVTSHGDWKIVLALNPGAIMSQARILHKNITLDQVNSHRKKGWLIRPDFHLSFRSSGLYWMECKPEIENYLEWFTRNEIAQLNKSKLRDIVDEWEENGIVSNYDNAVISKLIKEKGYTKYNVCPGLEVSFEWQSEEAIKLDLIESNTFINVVREKIMEALSLWEK